MTPDPRFDGQPMIPWAGGACPVPGDTLVRVTRRSGTRRTRLARWFGWSHYHINGDIIAYQVAKTEPVEAPEKMYFWRRHTGDDWFGPHTRAEIVERRRTRLGDIQLHEAGPILFARIETTTKLVIEGEG